LARSGLHGNVAEKRTQPIGSIEMEKRSTNLLQARKVASDELRMQVNYGVYESEEDDLYNPCGEAVNLKNTV